MIKTWNTIFIAFLVLLAFGKKLPKLPLPPFKMSPMSEEPGYITIAILGTNDIHGALYERSLSYNGVDYKVGGFKLLSAVVDIFRKQYQDRFLWLDAGDEYQGTYENSISNGNFTQKLFTTLKPDTATLGNHEWDWKEDWLRNKMSRVYNFTYVVANLEPKGNNTDLPNKSASKLFTFKQDNIRIGVIGLLTKETTITTSGFPKNHFTITEYLDAIGKEVPKLKNAGANAILLLTHIGSICLDSQDTLRTYQKRTRKTPQMSCPMGEMAELLSHLNETSGIDAVIAGHEHAVIHNWINNIPVIQNPMSNIFANALYLKFNKETKILDRSKIVLEGPIPLCSKVFSFNNRCDMYVPEKQGAAITTIQFHGSDLIPNAKVLEVFKEFPYKDEIERALMTKIAVTDIPLSKSKDGDSNFGNILSDILRNETNADFGICAFGTIRAELPPGTITQYDIQKVFPFDNRVASISVTGQQMKRILTILQEGAKGFYAMSGVKMTIELDGIKKKVLNITKEDGSEIEDDKIYKLGSYDFLLQGGDDFEKVYTEGVLPVSVREEMKPRDIFRDVIPRYFKKIGLITDAILPKSPRLNIIVK